MTKQDIARIRLHNQQLSQHAFTKPEEIVEWMGAVQGQDYLGALWSVGMRLKSSTETQVEKSLNEGKILRTWPMRGTLHFVSPKDIRWMVELTRKRQVQKANYRLKQLELTTEDIKKSGKIFEKVLAGKNYLNRKDLYQKLESGGVSTRGQRGIHLLWWWHQHGLICYGPRVGKQQTWALIEERVPKVKTLTWEESLIEMVRRYYTSHGPATVDDFLWWTGLARVDTVRAIESIKSELMSEEVEGKTYWMLRNARHSGLAPESIQMDSRLRGNDTKEGSRLRSNNKSRAYFLATYDEYLLGYADRTAAIDPKNIPKMFPGGGMFWSTIAIDGLTIGTWRRIRKKDNVEIQLKPFSKFTTEQMKLIKQEAHRYGTFLGLSAVIN